MSKLTEMEAQLNKKIEHTSAEAPEHISTEEQTPTPEHMSAEAPEHKIELKRENLSKSIKINNYKEYFENKLDKDKLHRLSFWVNKDHIKILKRIQYKIFDTTGITPDPSEIMRFVLDEGLPKFEKIIDRESEKKD